MQIYICQYQHQSTLNRSEQYQEIQLNPSRITTEIFLKNQDVKAKIKLLLLAKLMLISER